MPKQDLKEYLKFKSSPELSAFQMFQDTKKRINEEIEKAIVKIRADTKKIVQNEMKRIEEKDPINQGFIEKIVAKITSNLVKETKGDKGDRGEKGEQGDRGEIGYTPIKGKDYFTGPEIDGFKKDVTPIKGKDYFDGLEGQQGEKGEKGDKGNTGLQGIPGKEGKAGSPDTPQQVRDKLQLLKGNERLDASAIKNLREIVSTMRTGSLHRGGIKMYVGYSLGTGDGTTVAFTLPSAPYDTTQVIALVGGGSLFPTSDFTISAKTITFITAPPNGASVRATYQGI